MSVQPIGSSKCGQERCNNVGSKSCGNCLLVKYCSKECQRLAWKTHKIVCKPAQAEPILPNGSGKIESTAPTGVVTKVQAESSTKLTSFIARSNALESTRPDFLTSTVNKKEDQLAELLKDEKYDEFLKRIKDLDVGDRMKRLSSAAQQGHVPLMMELALFSIENIKKANGEKPVYFIEQASKWCYWGLHCTKLDLACVADGVMLEGALTSFKTLEEERLLLLTEGDRNKYGDEYRLAITRSWFPKQTHPSPKWLIRHETGDVNHDNSFKPQDEWYKARLEKHRQLIDPKNI